MAHLVHTFPALDPGDPAGLKTRDVGLEAAQLDAILRGGHLIKLARLLIAKEVVADPTAVFQGFLRPDQDDSLCYCGSPGYDKRGPDITKPAPPGFDFCVFVGSSGKLFDWRWERSDASDPALPENYLRRFERQLWPKT